MCNGDDNVENKGSKLVGSHMNVISSVNGSVIKNVGKAKINVLFSPKSKVPWYQRKSFTEKRLDEREGTYNTLCSSMGYCLLIKMGIVPIPSIGALDVPSARVA